ncbi:MAG: hypothetical protein KDJ26_07200 [Alphaproteobacteria bacterium]|nr:hypothetical protein [Alphaproteobacteria bacterium]MCB9984296.1 hypothetical protein [Micavibrio sp.]HPQ50944.1 hypothetical protein [Alphaproteobacteria bacterium]
MGNTFRQAHNHPVPSLRSAFRGVEWMVAGTFSGASLCKLWVQRLMSTLNNMHLPYRGKKLSSLFSIMAGFRRREMPQPRPKIG